MYDLVHRVNANMLLHELRYDNDVASVRVRLQWTARHPPRDAAQKLLRSDLLSGERAPPLRVPRAEREHEDRAGGHEKTLGCDAERDGVLGVHAAGDEDRRAGACLNGRTGGRDRQDGGGRGGAHERERRGEVGAEAERCEQHEDGEGAQHPRERDAEPTPTRPRAAARRSHRPSRRA